MLSLKTPRSKTRQTKAAQLIEATAALKKKDKKLGKVIDRVGPCAISSKGAKTIFESLARSIIYQQLSGKAASIIFSRVKALLDCEDFPTPDFFVSVESELLRGAGLSQAKMRAIKDLAEKTVNGVLPKEKILNLMEDEELVECLTGVRGIGRWTAEMLMIFHMKRLDVLPISDLGVRKGFALTYGLDDLPEPLEIAQYGQLWRPYRSVATWYLWRAVELYSDKK